MVSDYSNSFVVVFYNCFMAVNSAVFILFLTCIHASDRMQTSRQSM